MPAAASKTRDKIDVLIADDHRLFAETLEALLATDGRVEVVGQAHDGREAVERAVKLNPDVVLMDIDMPLMDGFELVHRVRASEDPVIRDIPAAALIAYARSEDRARTLQNGFELHLAKPIDPVELASAVKALARHRSTE